MDNIHIYFKPYGLDMALFTVSQLNHSILRYQPKSEVSAFQAELKLERYQYAAPICVCNIKVVCNIANVNKRGQYSPDAPIYGAVVQLVRRYICNVVICGFESHLFHHYKYVIDVIVTLWSPKPFILVRIRDDVPYIPMVQLADTKVSKTFI